MGCTIGNDPVGTMRGSLCSGNCAGLGDGLTRMLSPLHRGSYAQSELGIYKDTIGIKVVEIIHIIDINCKNMSKSGNYGVSQDRGAGDFFARRDANNCFVENRLTLSNNLHIFFTHKSNICSKNDYKRG